MELTGKCKTAFENYISYDLVQAGYIKAIDEFYLFPHCMRFGVFVRFFDSIGYTIVIDADWYFTLGQLTKGEGLGEQTFEYYIYRPYKAKAVYDTDFETRQEAEIKAIEEADGLYNQE